MSEQPFTRHPIKELINNNGLLDVFPDKRSPSNRLTLILGGNGAGGGGLTCVFAATGVDFSVTFTAKISISLASVAVSCWTGTASRTSCLTEKKKKSIFLL